MSSTATEPNHGAATPSGLFPATTTTSSKSSISGSVAGKSSSAADSKNTAAAAAAVPTPLPAVPGLGALAAVIVWAVAVL